MPELPEVETTRRGIEPHVVGRSVARVIVRNAHLRWRVPDKLKEELPGQVIQSASRRGKYLLLATPAGTVILHLGMSGSLRVTSCDQPADKHDHVDIVLDAGECLRLRDPRRFGAVLWTRGDPLAHKLLKDMGPEPLGPDFDGAYLFRTSRRRQRAVRDFLLDGHVVAGVGNIYANESLFLAGIRPSRAAGRLTQAQCETLVGTIRQTLRRAIQAGGTTLRDFRQASGQPGYFQLSLHVYGRASAPCPTCGTPIQIKRLGQRSAFYCPQCQR
jgi:formamidopyrimidine-DNA glycosylase